MRKTSVLALVAILFSILVAVPAVFAQPDPPEGWLNFGVQNVRDTTTGIWANHDATICEGDIIGRPNRWSEHCARYDRRIATGQIDRLNMQAMRSDYYTGRARHGQRMGMYGMNAFGQRSFGFGRINGRYGGYYPGGSYGWGSDWRGMGRALHELKTPLIVGAAVNGGVAIVNAVMGKKKHADEIKLKRERLLLENGVHPEQQKAQANAAKTHPTATSASAPVVHDPTYGGQRRKSLINATGCVVSVMEANGDEHFIAKGQSVLVTDFAGMQSAVINGDCAKDIYWSTDTKGTVALLSCGPPPTT